MQSIRSKVLIWLLRNRHLLKFKMQPEIIDENFSVNEFRKNIDSVSERLNLRKHIKTHTQIINNINAEWIIPKSPVENKMLLYVHGGGFISGSCKTHRTHVAKFAQKTNLRSLVFDYRLAPEHPFPAAIEDCVSIYSWLLENGFSSENIAIGGESAGATLSLSLLLSLKKQNIPLPKSAFAISPVTDLKCKADSFITNADKDIAPKNSWNIWTNMYIADNDPNDPLLSPQFGDFHNMPPIYICVGTNEIHLDDCRAMADKIALHNSKVILKEWKNMVHAFPILSPLFPEAQKALTDICEFIDRSLNT